MDFEKWFETNYQQIRKRFPPKPEGKCLTEIDMACLHDGTLDIKQRKALMGHMASCSTCAENFKESMQLNEALEMKPLREVPEHLVEQVKALFPAKKSSHLLEIVLNITRNAIELVQTTGRVLTSAAAGPVLRTGRKAEPITHIKIEKAFENILIEVEIQKKASYAVDIIVKIWEKRKREILDNCRVTLLKDDHETRSVMSEKGTVRLEISKAGPYRIEITQKSKLLATIYFEFRAPE